MFFRKNYLGDLNLKINDTDSIKCIENVIFTLRNDVDIVRIARLSFLEEHLPPQLATWEIKDFNYSSDLHCFLNEIYNTEKTSLELFFETLYKEIKKDSCCRRKLKSKKCNLHFSIETYSYEGCEKCPDFLDNGIKSKLAACINKIGYSIDTEGFVISGSSQILDPERIASEIKEKDTDNIISTILPDDIIDKGTEMSEVYIFIYCIENSLRIFIEKCCKNEFGDELFDKINLTTELKNTIRNRKTDENKHQWLPIRGNNDLFYLDLSDLGKVIQMNWNIFKKYFPDQNWIIGKIEEISRCRNLIAHNSYIEDDEKFLLSVEYKQILKQISRSKS